MSSDKTEILLVPMQIDSRSMGIDNHAMAESLRRLLHSSWHDIFFEYDGLTPQEKDAISRAEFEALVPWVETARQ